MMTGNVIMPSLEVRAFVFFFHASVLLTQLPRLERVK